MKALLAASLRTALLGQHAETILVSHFALMMATVYSEESASMACAWKTLGFATKTLSVDMENAVLTNNADAIEEDHFAVVAPSVPHKIQSLAMTPGIYVSITTLRPQVFLNIAGSIVR